MDELEAEAKIFADYLVGQTPPTSAIKLYVRALKSASAITPYDQKWLNQAVRHPALLGLIDGGLALNHPESEVRRRLYLMFSILEARPEYADKFLPQTGGWSRLPLIIWTGSKAMVKGLVGGLMVRLF